MKPIAALALGLAAGLGLPLASSASPKAGDTLESVIASKGQPIGRTGAGTTLILTYDDEVITVKQGKVIAVRPSGDVTTVPERRISETEKRQAAARDAELAAAAAREASGPSAGWSTDYDAALATARSQNRKVFLFFTGSDWCGWCIRLNREILSQSDFARYAGENLVLVELDFPKRKPVADSVRARNEQLARKYGIQGFPTVVVLSPSGKVLGKLGYQQGGPGPFIDAIQRL